MFRMALRVIIGMIANMCPSDPLRASLYRLYGIDVGTGVFIGADVKFDRACPEHIHIGDRVTLGAHSLVMAHRDIPSNTPLRRLYPKKVFPTYIEHDAVLFPGVVVAPGVRIGHHSVITMGTVVHKDVAPYSFVVGNGFRVAKQLSAADFEDEPRA